MQKQRSIKKLDKTKKTFSERCYEKLVKVPKGSVTTYKELARAVGTKAYRAVGTAMSKNPNAPKVPCHRVVSSDGSLGGYAFGLKKKVELLEKEGVEVKQGKTVNLKQYMYRFR